MGSACGDWAGPKVGVEMKLELTPEGVKGIIDEYLP